MILAQFLPIPRIGDTVEIRWTKGQGKDVVRIKKVIIELNEDEDEDEHKKKKDGDDGNNDKDEVDDDEYKEDEIEYHDGTYLG